VAEKGWGGTHQGGGVGGGTRPRFHSGEVPSVAGSEQGVESVRRVLHGAIWVEEEGVWGRDKMGRDSSRHLLKGARQGGDLGGWSG
jgi:hypothetical protein